MPAQITVRVEECEPQSPHLPVLIEDARGPAGNPWGVSFMRMLDMSNDSGLFRTSTELSAECWEREGTDWVRPVCAQPRRRTMAVDGSDDTQHLALSIGSTSPQNARYVPLYEARVELDRVESEGIHTGLIC